jgi:predicted glycosyl hydrolase (DUF1957 family)
MKSREALMGICNNILQALYKASKPKGDFKKYLKMGKRAPKEFYLKHKIPEVKYKEIVEVALKKHKLQRFEHFFIEMELLSYAPTYTKEFK